MRMVFKICARFDSIGKVVLEFTALEFICLFGHLIVLVQFDASRGKEMQPQILRVRSG